MTRHGCVFVAFVSRAELDAALYPIRVDKPRRAWISEADEEAGELIESVVQLVPIVDRRFPLVICGEF